MVSEWTLKTLSIQTSLLGTSSGAGCICDHTNTKSPPYTLYTLEKWLEKKHLSLVLNINIRDMNETCKKLLTYFFKI